VSSSPGSAVTSGGMGGGLSPGVSWGSRRNRPEAKLGDWAAHGNASSTSSSFQAALEVVLLNCPLCIPSGKLNDMYGDYKYTYWACGIILNVSGIYLFIGMGINYRLVAKEQKAAEEKTKNEGKEEETNIDEAEKQKEANNDVATLPQKSTEDGVKEEESHM